MKPISIGWPSPGGSVVVGGVGRTSAQPPARAGATGAGAGSASTATAIGTSADHRSVPPGAADRVALPTPPRARPVPVGSRSEVPDGRRPDPRRRRRGRRGPACRRSAGVPGPSSTANPIGRWNAIGLAVARPGHRRDLADGTARPRVGEEALVQRPADAAAGAGSGRLRSCGRTPSSGSSWLTKPTRNPASRPSSSSAIHEVPAKCSSHSRGSRCRSRRPPHHSSMTPRRGARGRRRSGRRKRSSSLIGRPTRRSRRRSTRLERDEEPERLAEVVERGQDAALGPGVRPQPDLAEERRRGPAPMATASRIARCAASASRRRRRAREPDR